VNLFSLYFGELDEEEAAAAVEAVYIYA